ncbi:nuclease [Lysobacteraceae bacterium NML75-0749]|nr:nuclease [Xanthomonadaceae bacterium NML75-0749]PJK04469.1 nuclease [Xanthomonadaceae bacterium NML91-0268]
MRRLRAAFVFAKFMKISLAPKLPLTAALSLALAGCLAASQIAPGKGLAIGQLQGSGNTSPLQGQQVQVTGVITARIKTKDGWMFSLQDAGDGDDSTSDAVFLLGAPDNLQVGTSLAVTGTVLELDTQNNSHITAVQVTNTLPMRARAMPAAREIHQAPRDEADWERLEAMRAKISVPLTLTGSQHAARFGRWQAAFGGRLWTPTELALPGAAANQLAAENRARSLWLADAEGRSAMRREIPRLGSQLHAAEGIIDERFGRYHLQLGQALNIQPQAAPTAPIRQGRLRIAAFNLENLFNGDGQGGGFPTPRGAQNHERYQQQLARHIAALTALDADIIALMELENDGQDALAAESQLLAALNARHGGDWRAVPVAANANQDAIRNGMIYRSSKVQLLEPPNVLDRGPFARFSRPAIAARFRSGASTPFVVIANHLKSKGCRNARAADSNQRDGQSCWNATRLESVRQLDGWVQSQYAGQPVVMLGDFNAYAMEDPPRWLLAHGWQDAFAALGVQQPYSYVYEGQAGRLDHAFVNPLMRTWLTAAHEWHINADEAEGSRKPEASPLRSSDHDPLLLDFNPRH